MTSRLVFIDESIRSNRYLLCAVTVGARGEWLHRVRDAVTIHELA